MGTWVCALISPGISTRPPQSTVSVALIPTLISASGPTATMESPLTARAPGENCRSSSSMVRTRALVKRTSTEVIASPHFPAQGYSWNFRRASSARRFRLNSASLVIAQLHIDRGSNTVLNRPIGERPGVAAAYVDRRIRIASGSAQARGPAAPKPVPKDHRRETRPAPRSDS